MQGCRFDQDVNIMEKTLSKDKLWLFEDAPIWKAVTALTVPTVISQLIMMVYNLADSLFVGQLGDLNQLAAIALATPVQLSITALSNLFGVGGGVVISRALGARDHDTVRKASAFTVYSVVVVAAAYGMSLILFRPFFLRLVGATPAVEGFVGEYIFWVMAIGGVPSALSMTIAHLIRAEGASKEASFGLSMGGLLNIILDPIFIFPFGFGLEIEGAAIATCISNCIVCIYFLLYLYRVRGKTTLSLSPEDYTLSQKIVVPVILGGFPSALQLLLASVSNLALNNIVVGFSESAIAGVGICKKVDALPTYVTLGVTQGVVPLMAYNYGSGNNKRMKEAMKFTLYLTVGMALFFILGLELFPHIIAKMFIRDTETIHHASIFIRIHCLALPFMMVTSLFIGFFQAIKKNRQAAGLSLIRKGIFDIPAMFLLNRIVPLYGPIMCQPIMDFVSASCAVFTCCIAARNIKNQSKDKSLVKLQISRMDH